MAGCVDRYQGPWFSGPPRDHVEGDHIRTVRNGGKDYGNEWPVCPKLHDIRHTKGLRAAEKEAGCSAKTKAQEVRERLDRNGAITNENDLAF